MREREGFRAVCAAQWGARPRIGEEGRWLSGGDWVHSSALLGVQMERQRQGGCMLKVEVRRRVGAASFEEGGDGVEFQCRQAARGQGERLSGDGVRQEVTRRGRARSRRVPRCAQVQQKACSARAGRRRPFGAQAWRRTNAKWRRFSEILTLGRCSENGRV